MTGWSVSSLADGCRQVQLILVKENAMSMNLTLIANTIAVVMVGAAVALAYPAFPEHLASVGLAYVAGVITASSSRYHVELMPTRKENDAE
jgi:hypothetical protein